MNVLLDLNNLGRGFGAEVSRTGIFRTTEALTRALLCRTDLTIACAAESSWVSELLLLAYDRRRGGYLSNRIVRAWSQSAANEAEGEELIAEILQREAEGRDARRERAALMLLNATARRRPLPGPFDVVHSLRLALPGPERVPARARALLIHDLIPLRNPEWMYEGAEAEMRGILQGLDPARDFVLANSAATARDAMDFLGMTRERIFVTPLAADPGLFHPVEHAAQLEATRARYGIPPGDYVLSVCTIEPRKNLATLLESFLRLIGQEPLEVSLVLTGAVGWKTAGLLERIARPPFRDRVVLTGYVDDTDLASLYSGAALFAYPSLYEGFGLPVLEALQCGTPVITSPRGSLPEVAGDAAVYVDPLNVDGWADAMRTLLRDAAKAKELAQAGRARAERFSWERTADLTVAAYQDMVARS